MWGRLDLLQEERGGKSYGSNIFTGSDMSAVSDSSAVFTEYRACLLKHVSSIVSSNDLKRADSQGYTLRLYSNGPELDVTLPATVPIPDP